jgi:hypothetical protein
MPLYSAHFVNHADEIFGVSHFEAEDDDAAISHASQVFRTSIGKGYEIWRGGQLVHTETF